MANKPAVALDAMPDPADLRHASAQGMTYVAWCRAGKPVSSQPTKQKRPKSVACITRPWAPYRSKWEKAYANHLATRKAAGLISSWAYEPEKLVIGVGAVYTPDFRVIENDGSITHTEVKGYHREAAIVRIKAAALRYPDRKFVLVTRLNGEWHHRTIGAAR